MKSLIGLCILTFSFLAHAQHVEYSTEILQLDPDVRVESVTREGVELEIVHLGNGRTVEIPVDMSVAKGLTPSEVAEAREQSRLMLEGFTHAITSPEFNGVMDVTENGQAEVVSVTVDGVKAKRFNAFRTWLRRKLTTGWHEYKPDAMKGIPEGLTPYQKTKHVLLMAWQFAWVETVHAGIAYYDRIKAAPKLVEFGISVDVKVEPQIFIGKFNPTQKVKALRNSYALGFELSFDRVRKRVAVRTRLRREKGAGGLGLPAAKLELKVFETDGTHRVQGGQSWYPISPPFASFVLDRDHGGHYFAQGITFGANTGDLIPGSTLTNTFTNYQQKENPIDIRTIPAKVETALHQARTAVLTPTSVRAPMCSSLFSPSF